MVWVDSAGVVKQTSPLLFAPVTAERVRLYSDNTGQEPSILESGLYSTREQARLLPGDANGDGKVNTAYAF